MSFIKDSQPRSVLHPADAHIIYILYIYIYIIHHPQPYLACIRIIHMYDIYICIHKARTRHARLSKCVRCPRRSYITCSSSAPGADRRRGFLFLSPSPPSPARSLSLCLYPSICSPLRKHYMIKNHCVSICHRFAGYFFSETTPPPPPSSPRLTLSAVFNKCSARDISEWSWAAVLLLLSLARGEAVAADKT